MSTYPKSKDLQIRTKDNKRRGTVSPGSTNEWPDVAELETQRVEADLKEIEQFRSSGGNGNAADLEQLVVMLKAALVPSSMNHTETELVAEREVS